MGYAFYEIDGMERGYGVDDTCTADGCAEPIDRGLAYLCYRCTFYFCGKHLHYGERKHDCFAGESTQVCDACEAVIGDE